jgi:antitoxin component YwqK of YwqJK toxin-antitoxin module
VKKQIHNNTYVNGFREGPHSFYDETGKMEMLYFYKIGKSFGQQKMTEYLIGKVLSKTEYRLDRF